MMNAGENTTDTGRYDLLLTAAYICGMLSGIDHPLVSAPYEALNDADCKVLLALAAEHGLDLHHFKRYEELPRVRAVLGFLRSVYPDELLDVGSGRGVFLFPFLRAFPDTPVTAIDLMPRRVEMLDAVRRGGRIERLTVCQADICIWDAPDRAYDTVSLQEVLEHIPNVRAAVTNACRIARRFVIVTVPSKPDNNPEHIHLLTKPLLTEYFYAAGCVSLRFDAVPGHLIMIARKGEK